MATKRSRTQTKKRATSKRQSRATGGQTKAAMPPAPSLIERLEPHLSYLRLPELHQSLGAHLQWAEQHPGAALELLERVFADLASRKCEHRIERRIKGSGLKDRKTLEAFNWAFQPKLSRPAIEELATLAFIDQREDLLFTGESGTGKSHILKALTMRACHQERMVRYARAVDLIEDLYAGLADDTYTKRLRRWCRPDFLVIDDIGLGQLKRRPDEPTAAHMLFNLLDQRHLQRSTGLTSNIKLSQWGRYLGDATLAAAILDRLAMNSIRIDIKGPSYRQHLAKLRAEAKRKK